MLEMVMQQANQGRKKWVMLVAPGSNLATLGALLLIGIHFLVDTLAWSASLGKTFFFYHSYGLSWEGLKAGGVIALLTHPFLHGNWMHVIVNAILFYYTAARLGHVLRASKVALLFLSCALIAAIPQVIAQAIWPQIGTGPLVGASGGVMGMFLAVTVLYPDSKMILLNISARNVGKGFLIASSLFFLMTPELGVPLFWIVGEWSTGFYGREIFQIAHLPHFFGGLSGMLLVGRMLPALITLDQLQTARIKREGDQLPKPASEFSDESLESS